MTKNNFFIYAPKVLLITAWEIVYFPLWWYGPGFFRLVITLGKFIANKFTSLGLGVWLKNLFVPMYGQHDFAGRFISFFVRVIQIIFRAVAFMFFLFIATSFLLAWLLFPPVLLYVIWHQINIQ